MSYMCSRVPFPYSNRWEYSALESLFVHLNRYFIAIHLTAIKLINQDVDTELVCRDPLGVTKVLRLISFTGCRVPKTTTRASVKYRASFSLS
jgi:hypothetical protein